MPLILRVRVFALVCVSLLSTACGSRSSDASFADGVASSDQGGKRPVPTSDDEAQEASEDAIVEDAGAQEEAAIEVSPCAFDEADETLVAETFVSPTDPLALSVRADGSMLSWVAYDRGARRVSSMWFGRETASAQQSAPGRNSQQAAPSSSSTDLGFISVWSDAEAEGGELFANVTFESGTQHGESTRLTTDAADDQEPLVATGADGRVLVVWKSRALEARGRAMLVDAAGIAMTSAHDLPGLGTSFGRAALAAFNDGYLLAWIDGATRHVMLLRLNAEGAVVSAPQQVDADGSAEGQIDLSTSDAGGAIAYGVRLGGVRSEIRVRTFDAKGSLTSIERSVGASSEAAQSPRIAAFRGGFVVLYRAEQEGARSLRVAFLGSDGDRLFTSTVRAVNDVGLATALQVSPDGLTLFLAWTDQVEDTGAYELRRATVLCD